MTQNESGAWSRRSFLLASAAGAVAAPLALSPAAAEASVAGKAAASQTGSPVVTESPSGRTRLVFTVTGGVPSYSLAENGLEVIPASPLGLTLDDTDFTKGLTVTSVSAPRPVRIDYTLTQGKVSRVSKTMTERQVTAVNADGLPVTFVLRADEGGVAIRYEFPDRGDGKTHTVLSEATGLNVNVPSDGGEQFTIEYATSNPDYQEYYLSRTDHVIPKLGTPTASTAGASFPLLLRTAAADGSEWWAFASESGMDGTYPACHLQQPALNAAGTQASYVIEFPLASEADSLFGTGQPQVSGAWHTPWRYVAVDRETTQLVATTLTTDLAVPAAITDTSWIKLGSSSWNWIMDPASTTSLELTEPFFAFAQQMGWPYSLCDSGWPDMTDADGNPVSLEQLVATADSYGIKLILWFDSETADGAADIATSQIWNAELRQQLFAQLQSLGVAGVKVDKWRSDKQAVFATQKALLEDAARYGLLVIFDDTTIPRGWDRTYPHLACVKAGITSEGDVSTSATPDQMPEQHTIQMMLRNVLGAFEYCPTVFAADPDPGSPRRSTDAQELAQCVGYQAGIQVWSDNPADYNAQPAAVLDVLRTVPAAWDETVYLAADPASHVVVARRKGSTWWIAGINGKTLTIAPTTSHTSPEYFPPTGQAIPLTVDLSELGVRGQASVQLFSDTSATNPALKVSTLRAAKFTVDTAPFGGFLAIVR